MSRTKPKWWSQASCDKIDDKRKAYQTWIQTQDPKDWDVYAKKRNLSKSSCRKADCEYQRKIASESKTKPKMFYSFVNSKLKVREGIGDLDDGTGNKITSEEGKAEVSNNFFCSVFTKEKTDEIPNCESKSDDLFLNNIEFTKDKVYKKLKDLDPSKSGGPDEIPSCVLKALAEELSEPLSMLFNQSMKEGRLPRIWKDANVTPLFKKGEKTKANNYRPVSLTCILCKVMESIIRDELITYLEKNDFLSIFQHGFISKRSCTTNLLATLDAWTTFLDEGSAVDAIYLDFSKAFDSVPHLRLIEKLKAYGVNDNLLAWIKDFLVGRRQRVCVNGSFSNWSAVTSGVPQGSCLGPVLFVIFINDLPEVVTSLCQMYADDTKLFSKVNDLQMQQQIQKDLDSLMNWADKWQLRFNSDKCHVLHLGFNNSNYSYFMKAHDDDSSVELETARIEKDLGVQVDDQLKFTQHIEGQVNKANKILGMIRRSFTFLDQDMMKQLYVSMVRPLLEFSNVAWSPRYSKDQNLLERVQKRATKMVPKLKKLSYENRLKAMDLPSLAYRRKRGDLIEAYKYTHGYYSVNEGLLERETDKRTRGHQYKLKKKGFNTNLRKNFFSVRVINDWNKLPSSIVDATTMDSFKSRLDHHFENIKYCV